MSTGTLSDLLWKYFQYAKFVFMLVGLWVFLSFYRGCSVNFIPRGNYQMSPTYTAGNSLVVSDPTVDSPDSGLERGDAVIYGDLKARNTKGEILLMGRVIATAGERVSAIEGEVYVNGKKISEAGYMGNTNREAFHVAEIIVPAGHVFLLVDARDGIQKFKYEPQVRDSRQLGPIPIWTIKSKITSKFKYGN